MEWMMEVPVAVPAARAWELVGERFGEIAGWATPILESALDGVAPAVGVARVCRFAGRGPIPGGTVRERLIEFDPAGRSLAYRAEAGLPGFVVEARSRWSVHPDGDQRCVVRVRAMLRLAWWIRPFGPVLRRRTRHDAEGVMRDLVTRLETGKPHSLPAPSPGPIVR